MFEQPLHFFHHCFLNTTIARPLLPVNIAEIILNLGSILSKKLKKTDVENEFAISFKNNETSISITHTCMLLCDKNQRNRHL